ncbi:MAG: Dna2/Cas4 domain-containing protein [Candidatus Aenigmatarchaeota archaeon]
MKLKIDISDEVLLKSIEQIDFVGKKTIDDIILNFLNNEIYITDILFLLLQKLSKDEKISSINNEIHKSEKFSKEYINELLEYLKKRVENLSRKVFLTPLEISKFFQCQRRFFLEKVTHSKQKKSEKSFEGEVLHKSICNFIKNYNRYIDNLETLITLVSEDVLKEYRGKTKMNKDEITKVLFSLNNLLKKLNLRYVFSEPFLISIKHGVVGTPDMIVITKDGKILPIEIKTNVKKIKKGLKIQLAGEVFVVESFFRREINEVILLSLNNRKMYRIRIGEEDKRMVQNLLRSVKKVLAYGRIPQMSNLPNFRKVVCPYCHVKEVCDFIEEIRKTIKTEMFKKSQ